MATYEDFDEEFDQELLLDFVALPSNFKPVSNIVHDSLETENKTSELKPTSSSTAEENVVTLNPFDICQYPPETIDHQLDDCERLKAFNAIEENWHSYGNNNCIFN